MDRLNIAITMLKIRFFEESLDGLFERGEIFGTFHRCIGQESIAMAFTYPLNRKNDFIVSNHRNHGHYLAFTQDFKGLLNEIKGLKEGVSGGRGGSQVIFGENFISNGILGSTVSLATGISFGKKKQSDGGIVICFMGDGALGEGIVYESLNMASLWKLPIIYVLELNHLAQSTNIEDITAGSIEDRFKAFGIDTKYLKTTDVFELINESDSIIKKVRLEGKPFAVIVETERLCAHSKGDDDRTKNEINSNMDPILTLENKIDNLEQLKDEANDFIKRLIKNK